MGPDGALSPFIETRCDPFHHHIRADEPVERGVEFFNRLREGRARSSGDPENQALYREFMHSKIVYPSSIGLNGNSIPYNALMKDRKRI